MPTERNADFEALLQYLKASRGFDFTGYKRSTLTRRVMKRMAALKDVKTFGAYQVYLEVHPEEFRRLLVLRDHGPPHFLDRLDAHRTVAAGAAQHDADRPLLVTCGHRFEQQIG